MRTDRKQFFLEFLMEMEFDNQIAHTVQTLLERLIFDRFLFFQLHVAQTSTFERGPFKTVHTFSVGQLEL